MLKNTFAFIVVLFFFFNLLLFYLDLKGLYFLSADSKLSLFFIDFWVLLIVFMLVYVEKYETHQW
jgi:hypothetical protein